jgi:hypothetical protein
LPAAAAHHEEQDRRPQLKPATVASIQPDVNERLALIIVTSAGAYVAAGLVFAAAFVTWGVRRIDAAARAGTLGFRLIILPGVVVLWPVLLIRWRQR